MDNKPELGQLECDRECGKDYILDVLFTTSDKPFFFFFFF